ncbi:Uncharacterised protein [Acinetobacter baumannii]|nr:Uncharacterised protein [Acinetobacter baumannii]
MAGHQGDPLAAGGAQQVAVRQAAVPDLHQFALEAQVEQGGAAEHADRQDALQLGVHLAEDVGHRIALGGHPVEHLGQRHRADRRRQAVAGEVAEQHVHAAGRLVGGQQQVAVEQREGRLQVAHVAGVQAAGMGHLVEHRLGHPLFVEQVLVVPDDQVALLQHRSLQQVQASHGVDLGFEDHPVVRLGEEVVAARLQALHQRLGFAEGGEEDDRHQLLAGLLLDPPGSLEAIHHRHHHVHQDQLRPLGLEQRHRLQAVAGGQHAMPLAADDGRQQQAVGRVVLGDENRQALDPRRRGIHLS